MARCDVEPTSDALRGRGVSHEADSGGAALVALRFSLSRDNCQLRKAGPSIGCVATTALLRDRGPSVTTGTSSLSVGHQLARAITPNLVGRLESVAMLVQAGGIVTTAAVDKLLPSGQALL